MKNPNRRGNSMNYQSMNRLAICTSDFALDVFASVTEANSSWFKEINSSIPNGFLLNLRKIFKCCEIIVFLTFFHLVCHRKNIWFRFFWLSCMKYVFMNKLNRCFYYLMMILSAKCTQFKRIKPFLWLVWCSSSFAASFHVRWRLLLLKVFWKSNPLS